MERCVLILRGNERMENCLRQCRSNRRNTPIWRGQMDEIYYRRTQLYGRQWFVNSIGDYSDMRYAVRIAIKLWKFTLKSNIQMRKHKPLLQYLRNIPIFQWAVKINIWQEALNSQMSSNDSAAWWIQFRVEFRRRKCVSLKSLAP